MYSKFNELCLMTTIHSKHVPLPQLGTMKAQLSRKDKICQKLQSELKTLKVTLDEEVQEKEKAVAKHESDVSKYQVRVVSLQTSSLIQTPELQTPLLRTHVTETKRFSMLRHSTLSTPEMRTPQ